MWTKTMHFQGKLLKLNTLSKISSLMFLHSIVIINYENNNFKETDKEECHEKSNDLFEHDHLTQVQLFMWTKLIKHIIIVGGTESRFEIESLSKVKRLRKGEMFWEWFYDKKS